MSGWNPADLTLPEVSLPPGLRSASPLALTILYHPDPDRIGDKAVLPHRDDTVSLSRREPLFCASRSADRGKPLDDPYLSRSPVEIQQRQDSLLVRAPATGASLMISGRTVSGEIQLQPDLLEAGIVLTLAYRVVLLLHRRGEEPLVSDDCGLVGDHESIQRVRRLVERVAASDTHVLLLGESGTGKELVAEAIHARSGRVRLVAVNMAAVPAELAAAELFGVRRGAYTGADIDRPGYFQEADGGTLFLDEIGACGADVQAQLLRALQQGEVQSPGGGNAQVDTRVIAATDADPGASFSTALRHRLGGFEIQLPPLRERRADIGRLAAHFLPRSLIEAATDDPREVSRWADLMTKMALYDWPGNVRELANFCSQLEIASEDGLLVPDNISEALAASPAAPDLNTTPAPSDEQVKQAMLAARWEISQAARELNVSRQALYRRIEAIPDLRTAADIPGPEIESAFHQYRGDVEEAALQLQVSQAALRRRWRAMDLTPG